MICTRGHLIDCGRSDCSLNKEGKQFIWHQQMKCATVLRTVTSSAVVYYCALCPWLSTFCTFAFSFNHASLCLTLSFTSRFHPSNSGQPSYSIIQLCPLPSSFSPLSRASIPPSPFAPLGCFSICWMNPFPSLSCALWPVPLQPGPVHSCHGGRRPGEHECGPEEGVLHQFASVPHPWHPSPPHLHLCAVSPPALYHVFTSSRPLSHREIMHYHLGHVVILYMGIFHCSRAC